MAYKAIMDYIPGKGLRTVGIRKVSRPRSGSAYERIAAQVKRNAKRRRTYAAKKKK